MIDRQAYDIPRYLFDDAYSDMTDPHRIILAVAVVVVLFLVINALVHRSKTVKLILSALIIASLGVSTGLYFGIDKKETTSEDVTAQQGLIDHINSTRDFEVVPPPPPVLSEDTWTWEIDEPGSHGVITVVKEINVYQCYIVILHDRQYSIQCDDRGKTNKPLEDLSS